jgi:hypothetical protein
MHQCRDETGDELLIFHREQVLSHPLPNESPVKAWSEQKRSDCLTGACSLRLWLLET